jgi:hypothetical protein
MRTETDTGQIADTKDKAYEGKRLLRARLGS